MTFTHTDALKKDMSQVKIEGIRHITAQQDSQKLNLYQSNKAIAMYTNPKYFHSAYLYQIVV